MAIRRIFLDMDGVLSDFVGSVCDTFGVKKEEIMETWEPGTHKMESSLGITEREFWRALDRNDDLYYEMMPYSDYNLVWNYVSGIAPTYICSVPSHNPEHVAGKVWWIHHWVKDRMKDFILMHKKHLLADGGSLLIDDNPKNIDSFRDAGGMAIEYPRHWNRKHEYKERPVLYVQERVKEL